MQLLQLGRWVSTFDLGQIESAASSLRKKFRKIEVEYYSADLPASMTLRNHANPKKVGKQFANYVIIKISGKKALEFFGRRMQAAGRIHDENFTKRELHEITEAISRHNIYSFKTFKDKHPSIKYAMVVMAYFMVMFGVLLGLFSYNLGLLPEGMLAAASALFGVAMLFAYLR